VIVLGLVLLVLGLIFGWPLLWIIGLVLILAGAVAMASGRRYY
jgi:hypothetical protein